MDIVVFGRAAALRIGQIAKPGEKTPPLKPDAGLESVAVLDHIRFNKAAANKMAGDTVYSTPQVRMKMQKEMQDNAAVYRTAKTLAKGKALIDETVGMFKDISITDRSLIWNTDLIETLELRNLLANAATTVSFAVSRHLWRFFILHHVALTAHLWFICL